MQLTIDFTTASPINAEKLSRQNRLIYNHLASGKTITVYDAIAMGIFHLHSRISDLRNVHDIEIFDRTITENNTTCKEYSLSKF